MWIMRLELKMGGRCGPSIDIGEGCESGNRGSIPGQGATFDPRLPQLSPKISHEDNRNGRKMKEMEEKICCKI